MSADEPLNWGERLAAVEVKVAHIEASMEKLLISVERLLEGMNKMSGGWKAVMSLAVLIGGIIGAIGTVYSLRHR